MYLLSCWFCANKLHGIVVDGILRKYNKMTLMLSAAERKPKNGLSRKGFN